MNKRRTLPKPTKSPAFFNTERGAAYLGDAKELMSRLRDESVHLIMTSPPYALHFKKEYGNAAQAEYVNGFLGFANGFLRVLTHDGSLVLDIGGAWTPGKPTRLLYHFELLRALCRRIGFHLAQEFYWYNPAKLPSPGEWVTVRKIRVKDAVNCIWWLSKTDSPKADNREVLTEYSLDMLRLLRRGYRPKVCPSGHVIAHKFADKGGSIPPNVLIFGNNDANGAYMSQCKAEGVKPHPARFPLRFPTCSIRYLTDPGDLVLDPFADSNTTGEAAEREKRRWLAFEHEKRYLAASVSCFDRSAWRPIDLSQRNGHLGQRKAIEQPMLFDG
ncbi:MAG: site-specific DNA-methyltransferase [Phycisphaerae bacterium]|nr:site-specific DNA-methyltransferase [Phycisphaerae bacterium]